MEDKDPPKEPKPTPKQVRDANIAIIGFVIFGALMFFKLLESEKWSFMAWTGLGFVVLWIILPKLGTRIFFLVIGGMMLYGAINLIDGCSRSQKIRESLEGSEPGFLFPRR